MIGQKLGVYDVVAKLGAGGMGEVYRARDTRLDRDVAVKVLPQHLATDEVARLRFEREAKAIAALSHPNILSVYDVGTAGDVAYVVMELLEGETLRQRLADTSSSGPRGMPIRKVAQIGIEIAQGLAAAHDKQIVHRDIKPENVFLAADGRVKILDFGLARQGPAPGGQQSDAATALQHTDPGTVMGTIGYMAPEQVKAGVVDHRADVFALGCVLYEMASGHRPFARDSAAETMSAILRDDPPDLLRESGALPAAFEPIVRHCLEKRPEERFQSARDLAFALQSLGSAPSTSGPAQAVPARSAPKSRSLVAPTLVAIALAATAFFAGRQMAGGAVAGGLYIESFQQLTDTAGVDTSPTISPDGKTIVFVSDRDGRPQIYSQRLGSRASTPLTPGTDGNTPAFSPEGERIAFRSERDSGGVFLMTSSGDSVRRVSEDGYAPSWSPSGKEIVLSRAVFISPVDMSGNAPGLFAVDVASGRKREVFKGQRSAMQPAWSPHGQRIAFFTLRGNTGQRDIFTVAADGSDINATPVDVTNDQAVDWNPVWSPDGAYLYFSSNRGGTMNLWRIAMDESTGRPRGEPEPVTTPSSYSGRIAISRDGRTLAYASLDWKSTVLRQDFDPAKGERAGPPVPLLKGSRPIRDHAISPDGEWVVINELGAREDLIVARVDGREYRRLTDDDWRDRGPVWSPDGQFIYFYSDRGGAYDLWRVRPDGLGLAAVTNDANANFPTIAPDGRRITSFGVNATGLRIIALDGALPASLGAAEPAFAADQMFWPLSWSVSDRLLGIGVNGQGITTTLVEYDIASKQYRRIPGTVDRTFAVMEWLRDGRRFLVRDSAGIALGDSITGTRTLLTPIRGYFVGRSLSVSRDNTWYSYTETGTEGDIWIATVRQGNNR